MQNRFGKGSTRGTQEIIVEEVTLNGKVVATETKIVDAHAKVERWVYGTVERVITRFGVKQQATVVLYDWKVSE